MRLLSVIVIIITVLSGIPVQVQAQDPGEVGVYNAPPTFRYMEMVRDNGDYRMDISIVDINGWRDVRDLEVMIRNGDGDTEAAFKYVQFNETGEEIVDSFGNVKGGWLVREKSFVQRFDSGDVIRTRCTMNLTFYFDPGPGSSFEVRVTDVLNGSSVMKGPYQEGGIDIPVILKNPYATLSISTVMAIMVTLFVLRGRYASNKLAMSIERKTGGKEEPPESLERIMERMAR